MANSEGTKKKQKTDAQKRAQRIRTFENKARQLGKLIDKLADLPIPPLDEIARMKRKLEKLDAGISQYGPRIKPTSGKVKLRSK